LKRVFFGPPKEPHHDPNQGPVGDLDAREWCILLPIAAACLYIGLYPQPMLNAMKRDVTLVAKIVKVGGNQ
jgi:NADH-quinone oxidoreductase subunit M